MGLTNFFVGTDDRRSMKGLRRVYKGSGRNPHENFGYSSSKNRGDCRRHTREREQKTSIFLGCERAARQTKVITHAFKKKISNTTIPREIDPACELACLPQRTGTIRFAPLLGSVSRQLNPTDYDLNPRALPTFLRKVDPGHAMVSPHSPITLVKR